MKLHTTANSARRSLSRTRAHVAAIDDAATILDLAPRRRPLWLFAVPVVLGFAAAMATPSGGQETAAPVSTAQAPGAAPPLTADVRAGDESRAPAKTARTAPAPSTRNVALERALQPLVDAARAPGAATVLIEARTGRVLAVVESATESAYAHLATRAVVPSASIFKLVTTAALLENHVQPAARACSHGGRTRLQPTLLVDNPRRDHECASLHEAVEQSLNVVTAKLALKHLTPGTLQDMATRLGFGAAISSDGAVQGGAAAIPEDPFAFATTAAGFGTTQLSALHGAYLASVVANGGRSVPLRFTDDVESDDTTPPRALSASAATALADMMGNVVSAGTARRIFQQRPRLRTTAAGKTGSLADYATQRETTWFVGYAPARDPEVIVASVVVNTALWHKKAPLLAKETLAAYFDGAAARHIKASGARVASRE